MDSKIILVTGATQGIGTITATSLAKQGHTVVIHGRNKSKLEEVAKNIRKESGNEHVEIIVADLFSLADIKRMIAEFESRYERLDVLINNAGAILGKVRELTKEGHEKTLMLNLFAPHLLMQGLLNSLKKSNSARIINMSSAMHKRSSVPDFNDFEVKTGYSGPSTYGLSKLYLIWISRHLVKDLKSKGIHNVTVNVCHPGAVATNFGQDSDNGFLVNAVFKIALLFSFLGKPEKGSVTSVYLATSPEVEGKTGGYYGPKKNIEKPGEKFYSAKNEKIVWDNCQKIVSPYLG